MEKFIKITSILELWLVLIKWRLQWNKMKTTMHFTVIIIWFMYLVRGTIIFFTLHRLVFTKRSKILKQNYSFQLQVCLSACDLSVDTKAYCIFKRCWIILKGH